MENCMFVYVYFMIPFKWIRTQNPCVIINKLRWQEQEDVCHGLMNEFTIYVHVSVYGVGGGDNLRII